MREPQLSQLLGTWQRVEVSAYASANEESCQRPGCCFLSYALPSPAGSIKFEPHAELNRSNKSLDVVTIPMSMPEALRMVQVPTFNETSVTMFLLMLPLLPKEYFFQNNILGVQSRHAVELGSADLLFLGQGKTGQRPCMTTWLEGCNSNTLVVVYDLDFIVEHMTTTDLQCRPVPCQNSRAMQEGAWPPRTCGFRMPLLDESWKGRMTVSQRFRRNPLVAPPCRSTFEALTSTEQHRSVESERLPVLPVAALACIAIFVLLCLCSAVMLAFHLYKRRAKSRTRAQLARARTIEMMLDVSDSCEYFTEANLPQLLQIGRMEHWLLKNGSVHILQVDDGGTTSGKYVSEGIMNGTTKVAVQTNLGAGLLNELRILRHARHTNVVRLYGIIVVSSTDIQMVLEWVSGSNLHDYVLRRRANGSFHSDIRALATGPQLIGNSVLGDANDPGYAVNEHRILVHVAQAMQYLHSLDPTVVHGDLRSTKILVEQIAHPPRGKVSDFRSGQLLETSTQAQSEQDRIKEELLKVEVRAYGLVTLFIILGKPLEEAAIGSPSAESITDGLQATHGLQEAGSLGSLHLAISVAEDCLSTDMAQRPAFTDIFNRLCNSDDGNS
jgi:hypothetical protein